jgi:gamma-glutamylcyclotransferase (GGCT)/AIG2-like uncharacterized protein YtfP
MKKIIVYGTLKSGMPASMESWGDAIKVKDVVVPGFVMWDNGSYPMCVPAEAGKIHAELWEASEDTVDNLDSYEGHPDLFRRTEVCTVDGEVAEMYVFQHKPDFNRHRMVESGIWFPRRYSLVGF